MEQFLFNNTKNNNAVTIANALSVVENFNLVRFKAAGQRQTGEKQNEEEEEGNCLLRNAMEER